MKIKKNSILLVEGNADDRELAQLAFERSSIPLKMVIVESGVEALYHFLKI